VPDYLKTAIVQPDYPDSRDWIYRPALTNLKSTLEAPKNLKILNQHSEGACTGFALASAINLLISRSNGDTRVSARMLYEMAKRHDEWEGEAYSGSSLRGAIHGWKYMGVCEETEWEYYTNPAKRGDLTVERAQNARRCTLGAYYRLRPVISDYHAALNEAGVVVVSAKVHTGWSQPVKGDIPVHSKIEGGHAFVIVGYTDKGFMVQNSWGTGWGDNGLALWTYEDWIGHIMDGWVFRLALSTPQIFGMNPTHALTVKDTDTPEKERTQKSSIKRSEIAGHFVHIDDGKFAEQDKYWSTRFDVEETARRIADSTKYDHIVFYGHGGLNSPDDSARRVAAMKEVFRDNKIYPYHIMYDTGIVEELRDLLLHKGNKAKKRVGGAEDWFDKVFEKVARLPGRLLWDEMKQDALDAFSKNGDGTTSIKIFIEKLRSASSGHAKKIHLIGHSTGAILFAYFLKILSRFDITIDTCSLLAPACSTALYHDAYLPVLKGSKSIKINQMDIYNLRDKLERDDVVLSRLVYRKSLLYLVSNAFEHNNEEPLLGMKKFKDQVNGINGQPTFHYSNGVTSNKTRSKSHGGFDNDVRTMNSILTRILGSPPKRRFTENDLDF
jgi:Papain family cysteine protease